mgnify:CR=1 FL=1
MAICSAAAAVRLAHAGLKHPQFALLDGELDVAHVAIVVLENGEHAFELLAGFLQAVDMLQLGDRLVLRMPATTSSPWAFTR